METKKLSFKIRRQNPEIIVPAKPTPTDPKPLSDIDDREGLRYKIPIVMIYSNNPSMTNKADPVKVIREALSQALVYFYPFAGRLREGLNRKLFVDCTGEGIVFVEADADVRLDQLGNPLHPPFPNEHELLYDVHASQGILNSPLMSVQVTRLLCGGFIFTFWYTHTMCDGAGIVQFMVAVGEMARGATSPSVLPVWKRELLSVGDPPQITCKHREFIELPNVYTSSVKLPNETMVYRSFYFDFTKVSALRNLVPSSLAKCSPFDLLAACVWRCRTIALKLHPHQKVRLVFTVNARSRFNPPLPKGYYGNVCVLPGAISTVQNLCDKPLAYALELVMKAKANVTEEYVRSFINLTVTKGRAPIEENWTYIVVDLTRLGFWEPDFGWGKPVYGGMGHAEVDPTPGTGNYFLRFRDQDGDLEGIVAPICLPAYAMKRFEIELEKLMYQHSSHLPYTLTKSSL